MSTTHHYLSASYGSFEMGQTADQAYEGALKQVEAYKTQGHSAHTADLSDWQAAYKKWLIANQLATFTHYVLYEFWGGKEYQTRLMGVFASEEVAQARRAELVALVGTDWQGPEYVVEPVPYTPA